MKRINPFATESGHAAWTVVDSELLDAKAVHATTNPRRRDMHLFHAGGDDPLQRMINAGQPGTYYRPHRHLHPPKAETFVVLEGRVGFIFHHDDSGDPNRADYVLLDPAARRYAVDIRPGVWHALVILAPDTLLFETKNGPFAPHSDKDFAPWSPAPETPEAAAFVRDMEARFAPA